MSNGHSKRASREHEHSESATSLTEPTRAAEPSAAHGIGLSCEQSEEPAHPNSTGPLREWLLKCKRRRRKLKKEKGAVKRAQGGSRTLEQRRLYCSKIARRRKKLELKLLKKGQMDPQSPQHTHNSVDASSQSQARDVGDGMTLVDPVIPGTETPSVNGELGTPSGHIREETSFSTTPI